MFRAQQGEDSTGIKFTVYLHVFQKCFELSKEKIRLALQHAECLLNFHSLEVLLRDRSASVQTLEVCACHPNKRQTFRYMHYKICKKIEMIITDCHCLASTFYVYNIFTYLFSKLTKIKNIF